MKKITSQNGIKSKGHYNPGIISRGMLYVSGQLSIDPDTHKVPAGGIEEHAKLALANVERVLKMAGVTRSDVVQCRVYVANIADWDRVNEVYADFFGAHKPARVVVAVGELHFGCLVEIEAIADVDEK